MQYGQQESEDLSQQYVQSGQHEDLTSYEKPRRERIQTQQFERLENLDEQDNNQQLQAADLQRESSLASTGRTLLDQRLVVDEPQEFIKPIVKPNKPRESIDNYNLEQSGFYDNPKSRENSELNDNMQQSYERPSQTQIVEEKPSNADLTLENSGFIDHEQRVVTDSTPEQVTTFKNFDDSHKSEDLTLQKSGFFDQSDRQDRLLRVPELNRQNEDLDEQQRSNLDHSFSHYQRVNDDSSQMGINSYDDTQKDVSLPIQNRTYELPRNHHPRGQYIHNLPQQNEQSSHNIIDFGSDESNDQFNTANGQSDRNPAQFENQESLAAYAPGGSQTITRFERPVQTNQNINRPQQAENQYYGQNNNEYLRERTSNLSRNLNEFEPHRGDLPGQSQPIDEEPVHIPLQTTTPVPFPRPQAPVKRPYIPAPITEKPSQNIVEPEVPTERTPCHFNGCQVDQLGQSYYYRQQNQHNIRFSQSIYNNQQNLRRNSDYHNQNPFYQHNIQSNRQINHVPQGSGYTYHYTDQQRNHLRINHQGSTHPLGTEATAFEQNDLLGLNGQESSQQVYQKPELDNVSGHRGFSQRQSTFRFNQQSSQTSNDGFPAQVIPLHERQSGDKWADIESTTGQKLSNAYESVRGNARTIYG